MSYAHQQMHFLLALESTKIYNKIHTKMPLHVSVCDYVCCHATA
jgi:hypothetical protein